MRNFTFFNLYECFRKGFKFFRNFCHHTRLRMAKLCTNVCPHDAGVDFYDNRFKIYLHASALSFWRFFKSLVWKNVKDNKIFGWNKFGLRITIFN